MRSVEPLPSGRFKVRYRLAGKQKSQTFDTHAEAENFAILMETTGSPQRALDILYEDAVAAAAPTMDSLAADHIRLLTGIEEGTRLTYTRLWKRTWSPLIGNIQAPLLTRDHVAGAINTLARSYSAKSLKNQRGLLAAICGRAVDLGHLTVNPTKKVRLPRSRETERPDMRILTPAEYEQVHARIHPHYRPLLSFLAGTGARWGEAVALTVGDVHLPNVRIRRGLKWSPDNNRTIGATKTKRSNRTVTLPATVAAEIEPLLPGRAGGELLFTAPRGGPVHHRTFWSDIWLPAVEHLQPRPRIHDLRHTHAAWLLARGVPIHIVQARLGHNSIKTTVDTYGGLMPDAQMAAASAAEAVFTTRPSEIG